MSVPTEAYVLLSAALFAIGAIGVLTRRSAIQIFLCIELMLNAGNLALVAYARQWAGVGELFSAYSGQTVVFVILAVAAAEVAVGLGILVAIFRDRASTDVDALSELRA